MRVSGEPSVRFYVFDDITWPERRYDDRRPRIDTSDGEHLVEVSQAFVHDLDELLNMEQRYLGMGYEGLILRDPNGKYKFGRSTTKEGILLKLKRMETDEAVVIAVVEEMHNGNEATTSELGRTKRSSHKENRTGKGSMGALHVRDVKTGVEFHIGTGFTAEDRAVMWAEPPIGKIVSYNHFPIGRVDLPRHPSFKGFRDSRDMST
jgi:DNA ligase-1